jgi:predicted dehydrogenase
LEEIEMINVGVIGYGYWGPNLVRSFIESPECRVAGVCDLRPERLALVNARYQGVRTTTSAAELIQDPSIDAIAIATPVSHHYRLALEALQAGKHVLVEKPLTSCSEEAFRLIDEADRRKLILMVDHTFVYTPAVRKIRDLVTQGELGDIYYYDSVRVNLGLFQEDVDVIWDLAVHDFSIMEFVLGRRPTAVSATGISHVDGRKEDVAYITVFFEDRLIAHIHVNWLSPVKVRRTLIGGSRRMIAYDDVEPSEKVKVYDRGIDLTNPGTESDYQMMVSYRSGDVWVPALPNTEALKIEAAEFLRCIGSGAQPLTDGQAGMRVVQILEAATYSMQGRGRLVELRPHEAVA